MTKPFQRYYRLEKRQRLLHLVLAFGRQSIRLKEWQGWSGKEKFCLLLSYPQLGIHRSHSVTQ